MDEFEFDYKYYLETYQDLRHFTKDQALHHWNTHGKKEGRKCKREIEIINDKTNITIIIHLFHENLLDEFLEYIHAVGQVFKNVNVIFTLNKNDAIFINRNIWIEFYNFRECIILAFVHIKSSLDNKGKESCYDFNEFLQMDK